MKKQIFNYFLIFKQKTPFLVSRVSFWLGRLREISTYFMYLDEYFYLPKIPLKAEFQS